jgi:hypothetical protein
MDFRDKYIRCTGCCILSVFSREYPGVNRGGRYTGI